MISAGRSRERAWANISLSALTRNLSLVQERYGHQGQSRLMSVVKADAYGHDISIIAPACAHAGVTDFGVATVDEGLSLREVIPPASHIYLLAPTLPTDAADIVAHCLVSLVSDLAQGHALSAAAVRQNIRTEIHLEIDTGIGRAGVHIQDARALLSQLDALPSLTVTGLATHFASADEDAADAHRQLAMFHDFIGSLGERAGTLLIHASNSPAALVLPETVSYGMIRPGLLMYGIEPAPGLFASADLNLSPVLSLHARVLLCRPMAAGTTISYGRTYTVPPGGGVYATIGIGYGDGWPRRLGNGAGNVLLHGQRAPICGRVCMDQLVVDVSHLPDVTAGDSATLIGSDSGETITASQLAQTVRTTPHEITTCLTARIPRLCIN